jgi:hypothetical protein
MWLFDLFVKDGECPLLESARTYTRVTPCQVDTPSRSTKARSILKGTPRDHPIQLDSSLRFHACLWAWNEARRVQRGWGFAFSDSFLTDQWSILVLSWKSLRVYLSDHASVSEILTDRYKLWF